MNKHKIFKIYLLVYSVVFLALNSMIMTLICFVALNVLLAILALVTCEKPSQRFTVIFSYACLLLAQVGYTVFITTTQTTEPSEEVVIKIGTYLLMSFSFLLETFLEIRNYHHYFFHNSKNINILSFSDLQKFIDMLKEKKELLEKTSSVLTKDNISQILTDIKRTDLFGYTNNGTLTDEYFSLVDSSISDLNVYIVLSDTGSVTSQVVSLFTEKEYNHASISFDRELKTLISYNGGERVNPPGLNSELLSYLAKKDSARIYVYSLKVTSEQKQMMIDKIKEINTDGSAYNLLGLFLKQSFKPNIMYCSQFVYTLLEYAGVNYFSKDRNNIKPTDLIELDYYKKLGFEYEIKFN